MTFSLHERFTFDKLAKVSGITVISKTENYVAITCDYLDDVKRLHIYELPSWNLVKTFEYDATHEITDVDFVRDDYVVFILMEQSPTIFSVLIYDLATFSLITTLATGSNYMIDMSVSDRHLVFFEKETPVSSNFILNTYIITDPDPLNWGATHKTSITVELGGSFPTTIFSVDGNYFSFISDMFSTEITVLDTGNIDSDLWVVSCTIPAPTDSQFVWFSMNPDSNKIAISDYSWVGNPKLHIHELSTGNLIRTFDVECYTSAWLQDRLVVERGIDDGMGGTLWAYVYVLDTSSINPADWDWIQNWYEGDSVSTYMVFMSGHDQYVSMFITDYNNYNFNSVPVWTQYVGPIITVAKKSVRYLFPRYLWSD